MQTLDGTWLESHPLPPTDNRTDKNERGRVLAIGGSPLVPGALRLTGEAALRAGAGKLQMGVAEPLAQMLGMAVPEAGIFGLPVEYGGALGSAAAQRIADQASQCDALVVGPGMSDGEATAGFLETLLGTLGPGPTIIVDAGCIVAARRLDAQLDRHRGKLVFTPHHGEMAALCGHTVEQVAGSPESYAREMAHALGAVVILKDARTHIAAADCPTLVFESHCPGLATGGSGDVLAGIIAGLAARGAEPRIAAAWGVYLHAQAGRLLGGQAGPGLLARELATQIPALLNSNN